MPTPKDIRKMAQIGSEADRALYNAGLREGRQQMRKVSLDFLEKKYMAVEGAPRENPEGRAILLLTRELSEELKKAEND